MTGVELKARVRRFWNEAPCGEVYAVGDTSLEKYQEHAKARYALEPYIAPFAKFEEGRDCDILEVGVGMGADHIRWAKSCPRSLTGVDLTPRAIQHTRRRLQRYGYDSHLQVADAEALPLDNDSFDLVYSWGVLHHSPDTATAISEIRRVLRPDGVARIMIYHKYAITGYMLWIRYGLLRGRPWTSLRDIYWNHLESPGTKAFTVREAQEILSDFSHIRVWTQLSFGDLLKGQVGQRHQGAMLSLAKRFFPRALVKTVLRRHGLLLLIEATK